MSFKRKLKVRSLHWSATILFGLLLVSGLLGQINTIPDAQSQTQLGGQSQIVGTVFGPSGRPVDRPVRVRLSTMTRGERSTTTNETGNFAFRGLPTGSYTISIDKENDFDIFTETVDLRQFRGGPPQLYTMTIRLRAKAASDAKPAVANAAFVGVPERAQELYLDAVEKAKVGDRAGAVEQLKLAILEHPTFMYAYNELGVQYLRMNRLADADSAFQSASRIDPTALSPLVNRGIAFVSMKRHGEAVPVLRKAVSVDPESAVAHYFLGQALANLGLFDSAETELKLAIDLGKDQMKEAHRILAIIYRSRGDRKRTVENLEIYLTLAPNAPDAQKLRELIRQLRESDQ